MAKTKRLTKPLPGDEDVVKALIYCKHKDGELCNMCPYGRFAPHCSSILLDDAAARIRDSARKTVCGGADT